MKKKGFTLIELLAVILILGIIALIAIPSVTSIINESKLGTERTTANTLANAAITYNELCLLKSDTTCITDFTTLTDTELRTKLNLKGEIPSVEDIDTFSITDDKVNLVYTKNGITCTVSNSEAATCTM